MKAKTVRLSITLITALAAAQVYGIDISTSDSARLDIVSRTSFGIDLDNPYRFGLSNEITQFDLVFGLAPYQKISNRVNSPSAVGFIDVTLFNLDLIKVNTNVGYNDPAGIGTNRYQTGEFIAGILNKNWLIQLNAAGNEPFASPWNKGLQFVNDGFKFSWAYLDSMVDVRRIKAVSEIPSITKRGEENMAGDGQTTEHGTMKQFGFDTVGNIADRFGASISPAHMVAVMYNSEQFGVNAKLGTEYSFDSASIEKSNRNGIAAGVDTVFTPQAVPGLKIFASIDGAADYSLDENADPIYGGTRIGYTIPLNEDVSIEPFTGFDIGVKLKDDGNWEKPAYEISGGLTMRWPGQGGWLKDYILNSDGRVFPGMSLAYKVYRGIEREKELDMEHSVKFTLFEPRGDDGVFYGLGAEVIIDVIDITNVTKDAPGTADNPPGGFRTLATAYLDYTIPGFLRSSGSLIPWTILYYDNIPDETDSSKRINDAKVDLGLNFENFISNTTFGIVWNSGSLIQQTSSHWGYFRATVEIRL
ncbi:MAG: hypothetical protein LBH75_09300 [Treponema sp.]|jgi:hypothetical protein|nr:hypothetical protein [Treponema sp.]